jgi:hypothetical protein
VRAERVELSRACAHRILSQARLPFRHARVVDPAGLEPARFSMQTRCTATRALGPGSRWVESNDRRRNAARFTAALLKPTEVTGAGSVGVTASIDVVPIPNLAYYLVVNVREFMCQLWQIGQSFAQQGW